MRGLAICCGFALALSGAAHAQQQTVPNAHAFLRDVLRGGTGIAFAASDAHGIWGFVSIASTDSSACTTNIYGRRSDGINVVRTIDWRQVGEVAIGATATPGAPPIQWGIQIQGGVSGYGSSDTLVIAVRPPMRDRLMSAFNFLRTACEPSRQYGF